MAKDMFGGSPQPQAPPAAPSGGIGDAVAHGLGYLVGGLGQVLALRGGNFQGQQIQRAQALGDPAVRAYLQQGHPFDAGTMFVGGQTERPMEYPGAGGGVPAIGMSQGVPPIAQIPSLGESRFVPDLPTMVPSTALKEQQASVLSNALSTATPEMLASYAAKQMGMHQGFADIQAAVEQATQRPLYITDQATGQKMLGPGFKVAVGPDGGVGISLDGRPVNLTPGQNFIGDPNLGYFQTATGTPGSTVGAPTILGRPVTAAPNGIQPGQAPPPPRPPMMPQPTTVGQAPQPRTTYQDPATGQWWGMGNPEAATTAGPFVTQAEAQAAPLRQVQVTPQGPPATPPPAWTPPAVGGMPPTAAPAPMSMLPAANLGPGKPAADAREAYAGRMRAILVEAGLKDPALAGLAQDQGLLDFLTEDAMRRVSKPMTSEQEKFLGYSKTAQYLFERFDQPLTNSHTGEPYVQADGSPVTFRSMIPVLFRPNGVMGQLQQTIGSIPLPFVGDLGHVIEPMILRMRQAGASDVEVDALGLLSDTQAHVFALARAQGEGARVALPEMQRLLSATPSILDTQRNVEMKLSRGPEVFEQLMRAIEKGRTSPTEGIEKTLRDVPETKGLFRIQQPQEVPLHPGEQPAYPTTTLPAGVQSSGWH